MSEYKPKDVFLGVIDLFAVLLPGDVICFFLVEPAKKELFLAPLEPPEQAAGWVAFLVAAYLLGHFLSLVGAFVLDRLYDLMRPLLPDSTRGGDGSVPLKDRATVVIRQLLGAAFDEQRDSTVKWSTSFIAVARPDLSTELQRKEADQKMFRSLAVALVIALVLFAVDGSFLRWRTLGCFVLLLLSFWRFVDQRIKYSHLCYWYLIALRKAKEAGLTVDAQPAHGAGHGGDE